MTNHDTDNMDIKNLLYKAGNFILKRLLELGKITKSEFPFKIDGIRKELNKYYIDKIKKEGWLEPHATFV